MTNEEQTPLVYLMLTAWRTVTIQTWACIRLAESTGRYRTHVIAEDALIPRSRARIMSAWLRVNKDSDVCVFIDWDIIFETRGQVPFLDMIVEACRETRGIVGGPCAVRSPKTWGNVRTLPDKPIDLGPGHGVQELEYIGASFTAYHRDVVQAIANDSDIIIPGPSSPPYYAMFMPVTAELADDQRERMLADPPAGWSEEEIARMREYVSEDYVFCRHARALGHKVYVHGGVQPGHIGDHTYTVGKTEPGEGYTLR